MKKHMKSSLSVRQKQPDFVRKAGPHKDKRRETGREVRFKLSGKRKFMTDEG